jgi:hypothetical protein
MKFHETACPVVKSQQDGFILGAGQSYRSAVIALRQGKGAKSL